MASLQGEVANGLRSWSCVGSGALYAWSNTQLDGGGELAIALASIDSRVITDV